MKEKSKTKGITLIALVITIIILLILAGITISTLTGENGLFSRAKEAKEKTIKAELKEEIELAIINIQAEELSKGNNVTLETLAHGQLENKLEGITTQLNNNEITGEYKGYEYIIDNNLKVTIEGRVQGISISYKLNPSGYTNGNILLTIEATSTNGEITKIEGPSALNKNEDGTYTITQNGDYEFTVTDSKNISKTKIININKIDKIKPKDFTPVISEVTERGFTISVNVEDGDATEESIQSGIDKYEYYIKKVDDLEYTQYSSNNNQYTFEQLETATQYFVYVIAWDKAGNNKVSEKVRVSQEVLDYKDIYINATNGNNTTGDGTKDNPYATLDKIADTGIIRNGVKYTIHLGDGEYYLTTNMFELNCNQEIDIIGNKENTILKVESLYGNKGGGSTNYRVNLYRLVWNATSAKPDNTIYLRTDLSFYNVAFKFNFTAVGYSYFITWNSTYKFVNCTMPTVVTNNLRSYISEPAGYIYLINCYGGFTTSPYGINSDWNYKTNYITSTPRVDDTTYRITDSEEIWKNVGTGINLDGTQANLGVYGGEYSWEN